MLTAEQVLDEYFLEVRCMLLEIAATLDRYEVSAEQSGTTAGEVDPRLEKIHQSLAILADSSGTSDRAERLLTLFSDPID